MRSYPLLTSKDMQLLKTHATQNYIILFFRNAIKGAFWMPDCQSSYHIEVLEPSPRTCLMKGLTLQNLPPFT